MLRATSLLSIAVLILAAGCSPGAMSPVQDEQRSLQVIEDHSQTQDEAFSRIRRWVAQSYVSAQDVIQNEDRELGSIVLRGLHAFRTSGLVSASVPYTLSLDIRDQRVRFTFNFDRHATSGYHLSQSDGENMREHFDFLRRSILIAIQSPDDF